MADENGGDGVVRCVVALGDGLLCERDMDGTRTASPCTLVKAEINHSVQRPILIPIACTATIGSLLELITARSANVALS